MKLYTHNTILQLTRLLLIVFTIGISHLVYAVTSLDFASLPPTTVQTTDNSKPLVMLLLGKHDSLYKKAYTDLVDLNNDGKIDTTYDNSIDYYGYFNSAMCYVYDNTNGYFSPSVGASNHKCTGSANKYWSGNFLNWATMTRMDVLRKVLYGGYRSTDTSTKTVLERAYFPTDAHSFAKYYSGSDLDDLTPYKGFATSITICNTTPASSGDSQNITNPPLMRVAKGDFSKWAANERWQCTWDGEKTTNAVSANSPNTNDPSKSSDGLTSSGAGPDYIVRVETCDNNLLNASNCTKYPNGDYKPTGLLQKYGETGAIKFGLMTGSYEYNKSGGVLRKNISDFSNEVNTATDGTFTNVAGIVSTINALRVHGYNNSNGVYNTDDSCIWGLSSFSNGACSNWGNPMSEMYLEAVRYFADKNANSSFNATTDSTYIPGVNGVPGLSTATWSKPLNANNWCAKCSIIVLNTGPFSYDADQLSSFTTDLDSTTDPAKLTNKIGDLEGITNKNWFIGDNGTINDGLCTSKTITSLGSALGPCPDEPRLGGSFDIAGIAYWAHINNLNPAAATHNHAQVINTYAVSLSSTTPVITIPVPGSTTKTVKLIPACRDIWGNSSTTSSQTPGDCRLVDMQITSQQTTTVPYTGSIYVNWEDSEQGGDFDQDMWGTIDYSIDSTGITITTKVSYQSTPYRMGFGYVISGTTSDGFHAHSGINNFSYTDPDSTLAHCSNCNSSDAATSQLYALGSSSAGILNDPLWYTAKYGGYTDINADHSITSTTQWDNRINSTGAYGSDGVPDNYFNSSNPGQLATNLGKVLANITERVSSGTATAVIANSGTGTGMLVQALYQPVVTNGSSQKVTWVGMMHSLFLDSHNNLREDGNQNGKLDDYTTDPVVTLDYNPTDNKTEVQRYSTVDGINLTPNGVPVSLEQLKSIWSARDQLAAINNSAIPNQRGYNTKIDATHGRYIFTWIDSNNNGVVDTGETIDFTDSAINSTNFGWLDIQSDFNGDGSIDAADADQVVDYVRGEEGVNSKFRSRTIDYNGDGTDEVWRLGDIVNSSPVIVGAPNSNWDSIYTDPSYTDFRKAYADRRVMVYTGANDGMIHAFNGGFYLGTSKEYCTTPPYVHTGDTLPSCDPASSGDPLGSELWAYVPKNLLPHLQWLTEPDYPHVYYIDGTPQAFDVNIFTADTTHINGWGTILVVGMRLGGGDITYSPASGTTTTSRSAYVVLDITDPEKPPVLLAEITDPSLGFTTSTPSLMVKRTPGTGVDWYNPSHNQWYLVFGSGPNDLKTVSSNQTAKLYIYNLNTKSFVTGFNPDDLGIANSFVGDTKSVDWIQDFSYDTSYFGIVGGGTGATPSPAPTGRLMRLVTDGDTPAGWTTSTVIDPGQPFVNRPEVAVDDKNAWWVYAGTGRLYVPDDNQSVNQQSFYGIKEQVDSITGLPASSAATRTGGTYNLQNITGVVVGANGNLLDTNSYLPSTVTTFTGLNAYIESNKAGWFRDFSTAVTGSTRNLGAATMFRQLALFTSYTPSADSCIAEGNSNLYAVYYKTGTAYPSAGLGNTTCSTCPTGETETTLDNIDLGTGLTRDITVVGSSGACSGANCGTVIGGTSTGAIKQQSVTGVPAPNGRQSWREIIAQ